MEHTRITPSLREGARAAFSMKVGSGKERRLRNLFIFLTFHGPRLRNLKKGDTVWVRDMEVRDGYAYVKRVLSGISITDRRVCLYWNENHYCFAVDNETGGDRIALVEDEQELARLIR